jgi:hypothetical protein
MGFRTDCFGMALCRFQLALLVLIPVLLASCSARTPVQGAGSAATAEHGAPGSSQAADGSGRPPGWVDTPDEVMEVCAEQKELDGLCPEILPRVDGPYVVYALDGSRDQHAGLSIEYSAPRIDPRENAPPQFLHIVIGSGVPPDAFSSRKGDAGTSLQSRLTAGVLNTSRETWEDLGTVDWAGEPGELFLASSFDHGTPSIHNDHLVYVRESDDPMTVSVHAWSAADDLLDVMRVLVGGLP